MSKSTIISGDSISGLAPLGTNITTNIALNTTDLRGKIYLATAAAIVTLDAAPMLVMVRWLCS